MKCRQINGYWMAIRFVFLMVIAAFLAGCSGGGGSGSHTIEYEVDHPTQIEVAVGVNSLLTLKVSQVSGDAKAGSTYSITVHTDPSYLVQATGSCTAIQIGQPCQLYVSLKNTAKASESLKFSVVMPSGNKGPYGVELEKKNLLLNVQQRSVFPTNVAKKITVTNLSETKFFFEKPEFFSKDPVMPNIINQNSCITTLGAGKTCDFTIQSPNQVSGQIKFDSNTDAVLQSVGFSKIVVSGKETVNIPANTAIGGDYPFTYTFTNTSTILPATNVSFTYSFLGSAGFVLNTKDSTCLDLTDSKLPALGTCILTGTFTPPTTLGNKAASATLRYKEGEPVTLSSNSTASVVAVTGTKTLDIPANTAKGGDYPFTYRFANTSTILPATNVSFTYSFPGSDGFNLDDTSSCLDLTDSKLPALGTCTLTGTFTPPTTLGDKAASATLSYKEGEPVTLSSNSTASVVAVTGTKTLDIPANTAKGGDYPFTYRFANTSTILPATNVSFTYSFPGLAGFVLNTKNSTCLDLTDSKLPALGTCTLTGTFTPPTTLGNKAASATLRYKEGEPVTLSSNSTASVVAVTGTKTLDIPANTAKGGDYPFTYRFANTSTILPATNVSFTYSFLGSAGFVLNTKDSTCLDLTDSKLPALGTCILTGTFTPPTTLGNKAASATLRYKEGEPVTLSSNSTASVVAVTGTKTLDIPANTAKGGDYPFTYRFANTSTILPATNVSFTYSFLGSAGFVLNTKDSTCLDLTDSKLPALGTCILTGTFTPPTTLGNKAASATLRYKEGEPVTLSSNSTASVVAVTGTKTLDIPANTAKGGDYPFTYRFANTSTILPATNVSFTYSFPGSAGFVLNTKNSTCLDLTDSKLPALGTCILTGTFTPPTTLGNKAASATLRYKEGEPVTLSSNSTASVVAVTGTKTLDIPANTAKGGDYPFTYRFANTSTILPATNVSFTYSFPGLAGFVLNTKNSTCLDLTDSKLPALGTCTLTGTFAPETTGNKTASATLRYKEGEPVTLSSNPFALIATTPINTGPNTPTEFGWKWPDPRFVEATRKNGTPCPDAEYDKLTGLMWVKNGSTGGSLNWAEANTYASGLILCGYDDWRLPNRNVLSSLINTSDTISPASWLITQGFTEIMQSYWSSTVYSGYSPSGGDAWVVHMSDGDVYYSGQTNTSRVLPVRGPS